MWLQTLAAFWLALHASLPAVVLATRVAGGIPVSGSDVSFVASIRSVDPAVTGKSCTGALVHERLVLTTANCLVAGDLSWFDPRHVSVSLGAHAYNVSQALMPDEYISAMHRHNIGLLVLATAVPSSIAAPVEMLAAGPAPGTPVFAVGGGTATALVVLDDRSCRAYSHYDSATQLCAAPAANGTALCAGDEGAPLVAVQATGRCALVGVASYVAPTDSAPTVTCGSGRQIAYFERSQVWAPWIARAASAAFSDMSVSLDTVPSAAGPSDGFIEGPLSQRTAAAPRHPPWLAALAVAAAALLGL